VSNKRYKYLFEIYKQENRKGYATISEVANSLNVYASSTSKMVVKLRKAGYVNFERYGPIMLTEKGLEIGKQLDCNHRILVAFLQAIGIKEDEIEQEVRKMELAFNPVIIGKLEEFLSQNGYINIK
jgi:DtxR family transcriptional regulator, Mn-dependent transcriptional regulator